MFDIIFLSFNESNADKNWEHLKKCMPFPFVKRVDGVEGILNGHHMAAKWANTRYFYVVDGDNYVLPSFKFDFDPSKFSTIDNTYVWLAENPLNDLVYGYGGIKLFKRESILDKSVMPLDMTLSIDTGFSIQQEVASVTKFNTSPFETWKSAFRECVKLSQKTDHESNSRLNTWRTTAKGKFASYCLIGANDGFKFGNNKNDLNLINDFKWLEERFRGRIK